MFVEHTLLTELLPQLQSYRPHKKENKPQLMANIQTVRGRSPFSIPAPHPEVCQHTFLFMDHVSHSVGRPTSCGLHAFSSRPVSPAWSSPTWQSLDIPISSNPSPEQPPSGRISGCVFMPTSELRICLFTCIFLDEPPQYRNNVARLCTLPVQHMQAAYVDDEQRAT